MRGNGTSTRTSTRTQMRTSTGVLVPVQGAHTLIASTLCVSLHVILACVLLGCAPYTDATLLFACTATNDIYVLASAAASSGTLGVPIRRFDTVEEALANGWTHGDALMVMADEGYVHQWPFSHDDENHQSMQQTTLPMSIMPVSQYGMKRRPQLYDRIRLTLLFHRNSQEADA